MKIELSMKILNLMSTKYTRVKLYKPIVPKCEKQWFPKGNSKKSGILSHKNNEYLQRTAT
jgi:hypothetical protein